MMTKKALAEQGLDLSWGGFVDEFRTAVAEMAT